jgi:mRNA interferase HigB
MRIIAWRRLAEFGKKNPTALVPLTRWRAIVQAAKWASMDDVRRLAPNATVLNAERVKFEIGGGNFRLIVAIKFKQQIVFVKFVGTHADYDKVNVLTVSQF